MLPTKIASLFYSFSPSQVPFLFLKGYSWPGFQTHKMSSRSLASILGLIRFYEFILRFSRSLLFRIGGSSRFSSFEVISPARKASQRLLMRSCVWVRDLRVASLHFAESVSLLVATPDLIMFLFFLISLMWLPPHLLL